MTDNDKIMVDLKKVNEKMEKENKELKSNIKIIIENNNFILDNEKKKLEKLQQQIEKMKEENHLKDKKFQKLIIVFALIFVIIFILFFYPFFAASFLQFKNAQSCGNFNCVSENTLSIEPYPECRCGCKKGWIGNKCEIYNYFVPKNTPTLESYISVRYGSTYDNAITSCTATGVGGLFSITTPNENLIDQILTKHIKYFWIGGIRRESSNVSDSTGNWTLDGNRWKRKPFYVSGVCQPGMFCNWAPGHPKEESCGGISHAKYLAYDVATGKWLSLYGLPSCDNSITPEHVLCEDSLCRAHLDCGTMEHAIIPHFKFWPKCDCQCNEGYLGERCEKRLCKVRDCVEENLISASGVFPNCSCHCKIGYTGSRCEYRICNRHDCNIDNTVNISGIAPSCICACKNGYAGNRCDDRLGTILDYNASNTKLVSGISPSCKCECKIGYTGDKCNDRFCTISECNDTNIKFVSGIAPFCHCYRKVGYIGPKFHNHFFPTVGTTTLATNSNISLLPFPYDGNSSAFREDSQVEPPLQKLFLLVLKYKIIVCIIFLLFICFIIIRRKKKKITFFPVENKEKVYINKRMTFF